jgi:Ribosomal protein L9, N-terminal domain
MQVILLKDIAELGKRGEKVDVKSSYAQGYLLPSGVAIAATQASDWGNVCLSAEDAEDMPFYRRKLLLGRKENVGAGGVAPEFNVVESTGNGFHAVVGHLQTARGEIDEAYSDVAHRDLTWRVFQDLANGPLWAAVEQLKDDPYRRQLADVLDVAVSKLEAFQLDEKLFSAIDSTLNRLAADTVSEDDVDACEREWEAAAVHTVPGLRSAFEEWLTSSFSDIEDAG